MVRNYKRKTEQRWSEEDLLNALKRIQGGQAKFVDTVRQTGISRATLYRHYQKFVVIGESKYQIRTCGGNPILSRMEEDILEKTVLDLRAEGFDVRAENIRRICFEYCYSHGIPNQFNAEKRMASVDWYYGFLKRHPAVRAVKSSTVESTSDGSDAAEGLGSSGNSSEGKDDEPTPPVPNGPPVLVMVEKEKEVGKPSRKRKNLEGGKRQVKKKAEETKTIAEVQGYFDMPLLEPEAINGDEGVMSKMQE